MRQGEVIGVVLNASRSEIYAKADVLVDPVFKNVDDWDTVVVTLTFGNGALGTIDNSRKAVYGYDQRVEVFGSGGMIAVRNKAPDDHVHTDATGAHSSLPLHFFLERYAQSYLNEMRAFVNAVKNDWSVPVTGKMDLCRLRWAWLQQNQQKKIGRCLLQKS